MEKEKVPAKVPWLLLIPLIIVLAVLSNFVLAFLPGVWAVGFALAPNPSNMPFWNGAFLVLFLFALAMRYGSKLGPANFQVLSYIFAAAITVMPMASYSYPWCQLSGLVGSRYEPRHDPFLPPWWMPREEDALKAFLNGGPIYWGAWLPVVINWIAFGIMPFLLMFSLGTLFRRHWLEVENLTFPFAAAAVSLASYSGGSQKESPRLFLASFTVFFFVFLTFPLHMAFPWIPDVLGWTYDPPYYTWNIGTLSVTDVYPSLAPIVGMTSLNLSPIWFALFYFVSLDVLFSMWFFWILLGYIIPQIAYMLGYYTGITEEIGMWSRFNRFFREDPLKLGTLGYLGVLPGILVSLIWLNRKYLSSTLRLAFGKATEAERETEKEARLTYRYIWVFVFVSAILMVAFFMSMGIGVGVAIVSTVLWLAFLLVTTRVHAIAGGIPTIFNSSPHLGWLKAIWPTMTEEAKTQEYVMATTFNSYLAPTSDDATGVQSIGGNVLDIYSVGRWAKASVKNIFLIILVAGIVTPIVSMLTLTAISYSFGFAKLPFPHEWDLMVYSNPETYAIHPSALPYWPQAIAGFVLALLLTFLRMRFIWWPLETSGLFLACSTMTAYGMQFPALIAWIFKLLLFRIGGAKYHERYGVPIVTGVIAGWLIAVPLIGGIVGVLRFFYPA